MISLRRLPPAVVLAFAAGSLAAAEQPPAADGAALYQQYCERCHGGTVSKAPPYSLLQIMSASSVLRAMESGVMQSHAAAMSAAERRRLAEHLTGQALVDAGDAQPPAPQCTGDAARFDFSDLPAAKGWGVGHDNRRAGNAFLGAPARRQSEGEGPLSRDEAHQARVLLPAVRRPRTACQNQQRYQGAGNQLWLRR